tara:strand:- start:32 stop:250 length:219 start_codon:yes stop_codon:yes gene_type:complete
MLKRDSKYISETDLLRRMSRKERVNPNILFGTRVYSDNNTIIAPYIKNDVDKEKMPEICKEYLNQLTQKFSY